MRRIPCQVQMAAVVLLTLPLGVGAADAESRPQTQRDRAGACASGLCVWHAVRITTQNAESTHSRVPVRAASRRAAPLYSTRTIAQLLELFQPFGPERSKLGTGTKHANQRQEERHEQHGREEKEKRALEAAAIPRRFLWRWQQQC